MTTIRASFSTARFRLRAGWKSLALMVALGGGALGVLFMAQSLSGGADTLSLTPIPPVGDALRWTADYREASTMQAQALHDLLMLLLGAGWVTLASALVSIVCRVAGQSALRRGEVAVRRAMGASKGALRLALVIEIGVASMLILVVGLVIGYLATRIGVVTWPGIGSAAFAPRVAFLLIALIVVTSIVLLIGANLRENLAHQDEGDVPLALPAGQLGFGLAILVGGSLVLGRAAEIAGSSGPEGAGGSVIALRVPDSTAQDRSRRYQILLDSLAADDGIEAVSLTSAGANSGLGVEDLVTTDCGQCLAGTIILKYHSFAGLHELVSPDTFKALGIEVVSGRGFTADDDWDAPRVAVVSRHLAYRHFERGEAIGRDIFVASGWPARPYKVVGIVADLPSHVLGSAGITSTLYLSVLQHPPVATELVIQPVMGRPVPGNLDSRLAGILGSGSTRGPAVTEAERASQEAAPLRWFAHWFAVAGWVMLGIAMVGTYAMLHLWVRSRAAELALRRSVGATRLRISLFVISRTMVVAVGGVALGLFLFGAIVRPSIADLFTGLPAWNPGLVIRISLLLAGTALVGSLVPTWRILSRPSIDSLHG